MAFLFQTILKITGIHQYSTAVSSEVTESSHKPSLISWFDDVFIPFTSKQSSWYALMNTGPLLPVLNSLLPHSKSHSNPIWHSQQQQLHENFWLITTWRVVPQQTTLRKGREVHTARISFRIRKKKNPWFRSKQLLFCCFPPLLTSVLPHTYLSYPSGNGLSILFPHGPQNDWEAAVLPSHTNPIQPKPHPSLRWESGNCTAQRNATKRRGQWD